MAMKVIQNLRFGELSETCCQDNEKAAQCRMPRCPTWGRKMDVQGWMNFIASCSFRCSSKIQFRDPKFISNAWFSSRFSQVSTRFVFLWWFLVSTTSSYPGFGICYVWVILSLMLDTLLESWGPCQSVSAGTAVALEARVAVVASFLYSEFYW